MRESTVVCTKPPTGLLADDLSSTGNLIAQLLLRTHQVGITRSRQWEFRYTPSLIVAMYPYIECPLILYRMRRHLVGHLCNAMIFTGNNALEAVSEIVGKATKPADCDKDSLRYRWWKKAGSPESEVLGHAPGGRPVEYHSNFIRCSRNQAEFVKQLRAMIENNLYKRHNVRISRDLAIVK